MKEPLSSIVYPSGQRLEIIQGDITQEPVDAIVNAANAQLQHGSGVAAAIVAKGGREIQKESDQWVRENGPATHIRPAITGAGKLPAQYIIHAVGPVWGEGGEDVKLQQAIKSSMAEAQLLELTSIAFPAISTGIFGFPKDRAARIFFDFVEAYYIRNLDSPLALVRLVLYDDDTLNIFLEEFNKREKENCRDALSRSTPTQNRSMK